ncbi:PD-(D/E)XK nuclease family protein [Hippea jasoniae]|uniref:PD-(D/E)XK nuclease family protein n=1 Tax=Hippea jasoniae TaxID=944479 RepID=UPI000551F0CE|nr:PD-(D/E)XK nuclease family protein [Hippea jasoniae]
MQAEFYRIDVGCNLAKKASEIIKNELKDNKKVIFVSVNRRFNRFVQKNLNTTEQLSCEFFAIDDFVKKIVMDGNDYILHSPVERHLFFYELLKSVDKIKSHFKGNHVALLKWAKLVSELFDDVELQDKQKEIKKFRSATYYETVKEAHVILEHLPELFEEYENKYKNYIYRGKLYNIASKLHFSDFGFDKNTTFIFANLVVLSESEKNLLKNIANHSKLIVLAHDDLNERDKYFDGFGAIKQLRKQLEGFAEIKDINCNFETPEIEFYEFSNLHTEAAFVADRIKALKNKELGGCAVVLANQDVVFGILGYLGTKPSSVNVTMGYPLKLTAVGEFFRCLFDAAVDYKIRHRSGVSVVILDKLLSNPLANTLFGIEPKKQLIGMPTKTYLKEYGKFQSVFKLLDRLCSVGNTSELYEVLKSIVQKIDMQKLNRYMFQLINIFYNEVVEKLKKLDHPIKDIEFAKELFDEVFGGILIPFEGYPLKGVQIMGMLEGRGLNFDEKFIVDAVEGVLPATEKVDPLMPIDLKEALGLTSYKKKELLAKYFFFREVFSSKKTTILYRNTISNNEKLLPSRFVYQLQFLCNQNSWKCNKKVINPAFSFSGAEEEIKNNLKETLKDFIFSPSAVDTYLNCPYRFYLKYAKKIEVKEDATDEIDPMEIGIIVHELLKDSFGKYVGKEVGKNELEIIKNSAISKVKDIERLNNNAIKERINKLKNLYGGFQLEALKIILKKKLEDLFEEEKKQYSFYLVGVEQTIKATFKGYNIEGTIDRLQKYDNGVYRIIDYKTGNIKKPKVKKLSRVLDDFDFNEYDRQQLLLLHDSIGSVQMPFYGILVKENFNDVKATEAFYIELKNSEKLFNEVKLDGNLDYKQLITYILNHIKNSDEIFPLAGENCLGCPFRHICKFSAV